MSYIGTNKLGTMYLGDAKIAKAYLGDDLVYSGVEPEPLDPKDYWLVSAGNSYLDTGYVPNANTEVEFKFYQTEILKYGPYLGNAGTFCLPFFRTNDNKVIAQRFGSQTKLTKTLTTNTVYTVTAFRNGNTITYNGTSIGTLAAGANTTTQTLYLFTYRGDPSNASYKLKGGIQYFKIYESGVLLHEFLAKPRGGVAGMYDTITGTFCPSITQTPFTLVPTYIETNGSAYLDTGITHAGRNIEITLVVQWTGSTASQFESFFAYMKDGAITPRCGIHKYNGKWMFGTNSTNVTSIDVDSNKHKFFLTGNASTNKEQLYIDDTFVAEGTTTSDGLVGNTITFFLGCRNRNGSIDNPCYARFYSLNVKKFGDASHTSLLVEYNFIPKEVNGVYGMYDTVNDTFISSASGTQFTGN